MYYPSFVNISDHNVNYLGKKKTFVEKLEKETEIAGDQL